MSVILSAIVRSVVLTSGMATELLPPRGRSQGGGASHWPPDCDWLRRRFVVRGSHTTSAALWVKDGAIEPGLSAVRRVQSALLKQVECWRAGMDRPEIGGAMTIADLIAQLSRYPASARVTLLDPGRRWLLPIEITALSADGMSREVDFIAITADSASDEIEGLAP